MLLKSLFFSSKGKLNKLRVFRIATSSSEKDILGWGGRGEGGGRGGVSVRVVGDHGTSATRRNPQITLSDVPITLEGGQVRLSVLSGTSESPAI